MNPDLIFREFLKKYRRDHPSHRVVSLNSATIGNLDLPTGNARLFLTDNYATPWDINLPTATGSGSVIQISNQHTESVNVNPHGTDTVNTANTAQVIATTKSAVFVDYHRGKWYKYPLDVPVPVIPSADHLLIYVNETGIHDDGAGGIATWDNAGSLGGAFSSTAGAANAGLVSNIVAINGYPAAQCNSFNNLALTGIRRIQPDAVITCAALVYRFGTESLFNFYTVSTAWSKLYHDTASWKIEQYGRTISFNAAYDISGHWTLMLLKARTESGQAKLYVGSTQIGDTKGTTTSSVSAIEFDLGEGVYMANCMVWDKELSDTEISSLMAFINNKYALSLI